MQQITKQDKQPDSSRAGGVAVPISASHIFSFNNSDVRSSSGGANSSAAKSTGQHQHKRTGSGTQTRPSKHFVFDYKPLTADHQDDEATTDADYATTLNNNNTRQASSSNSFTSALRRSLSPSPRLFSQQHAPLSPKTEVAVAVPPSPGAALLMKAKTVLGKKKLIGSHQQHAPGDKVIPRGDLLSSSSNSNNNSAVESATAGVEKFAVVGIDNEATTSQNGMFRKRAKNQKSTQPALRGNRPTTSRAAALADVNNFADFDNNEDDDDISSPYNADEVQTHVMPHGPAPEKDLQHLFNAPLQHRVPVDESEARKLERDLKNLMEAFENGNGDPFGLENDPVVQTMQELREKQEYITTQMFALDHTEYWNAENRFGMQKMKGKLNEMITAVDDLCNGLRQLPSHEEFDIHQMSRNRRRRRRENNSVDAVHAGDAGDTNLSATSVLINDDEVEISSPEISEDDQPSTALDDAGGLTFKTPQSTKKPSDTKSKAHAPSAVPSSSSRFLAHKRSVSHPEPPKTTTVADFASSTTSAATGGQLPQFAVPQAPPRSARRAKAPPAPSSVTNAAAVANDDSLNLQGSGDNTNNAWSANSNKISREGRSQSLRVVPSAAGHHATSAGTGANDDDSLSTSDAATVVYKGDTATAERGTSGSVRIPKVGTLDLSLKTGKLKDNSRSGVLELTERSTTPLHSPDTESFQSATSPTYAPR